MKNFTKKTISVFCAAVMMLTCIVPAFETSAATYTIGIIDEDKNTITDSIITLEESKNIKCSVVYIDCAQPNGSEIVWSSANGMIASVDDDGTIRARDSSQQALVQLWIDSDIKSIRGAGPQ